MYSVILCLNVVQYILIIYTTPPCIKMIQSIFTIYTPTFPSSLCIYNMLLTTVKSSTYVIIYYMITFHNLLVHNNFNNCNIKIVACVSDNSDYANEVDNVFAN